jgi:hypothetical protein
VNFHKVFKTAIICLVIFVFLWFFFVLPNKPTKNELISILIENGIEINGSDSNVIDPLTNVEPDFIHIILTRTEIKQLEIIEHGFDIFGRKYFAVVEIVSYSDEYSLNAKLMMFLHYDNGWKLIDRIGVLNSNFLTNE